LLSFETKAGSIAQVLRLRGRWSSSALGVAPGAYTPVPLRLGSVSLPGPSAWERVACPLRLGDRSSVLPGIWPSCSPGFVPDCGAGALLRARPWGRHVYMSLREAPGARPGSPDPGHLCLRSKKLFYRVPFQSKHKLAGIFLSGLALQGSREFVGRPSVGSGHATPRPFPNYMLPPCFSKGVAEQRLGRF